MKEFYVELQDACGTAYGTVDPFTDEQIYFDDLDEARLYAKSRLNNDFVLARVIDCNAHRVVDFFETHHKS